MATFKRAVNPYLPRYSREELEAADDDLASRGYEIEQELRDLEPKVKRLRASLEDIVREREQIAEALSALDA